MRNIASGEKTKETNGRGTSLDFPLPVQETELFKHSASEYILNFLADSPEIDVSIRQLARVTPVSERATREAVNALEANDLIEADNRGNARRVSINRNRLHRPDDPIHSIPQVGFRTPVRVARHYIEDELGDVLGIVLFGSVARGEADRQSDIDLWILVDRDSGDLLQYRNTANKLARDIEGLQIPPTISLKEARNEDFEAMWSEIREALEEDEQDWESADRHSFEFVVETPQSIINQSPRVDSEKLFGEGITLVSTEALERVKQEVLRNE